MESAFSINAADTHTIKHDLENAFEGKKNLTVIKNPVRIYVWQNMRYNAKQATVVSRFLQSGSDIQNYRDRQVNCTCFSLK